MEHKIRIKIRELKSVGEEDLLLINGENKDRGIAIQTLNVEFPSLSLGDELEITIKKV